MAEGARSTLEAAPGPVELAPLEVPHDCVDGFLGAFWRRPGAYLDPAVRAGMSTFARIDADPGLARLERDLADGRWERDQAALLERATLDLGYRIVTAAGVGAAPIP